MLHKIFAVVVGLGFVGFAVGHWGIFRDGLNTWRSQTETKSDNSHEQ